MQRANHQLTPIIYIMSNRFQIYLVGCFHLGAFDGIVGSMTRTMVDIDEAQLNAAARELGTRTKVETIRAALSFVAERRRRAEVFDDPLVWGSPDISNPQVMASARR